LASFAKILLKKSHHSSNRGQNPAKVKVPYLRKHGTVVAQEDFIENGDYNFLVDFKLI
jgi:hypothetical protein